MTRKQTAQTAYSLSELGRIVGVSAQAMSKYSKMTGFPEPTSENRWVAIPVIRWWLANRATLPMRKIVYAELRESLGIKTEDSAPETMTEMEAIELKLKAHKLALAVGDCVRYEDIRHFVTQLANEIRGACESVLTATGRDQLPLFEAAFERFFVSLDEAQ